jgi:hypothetical protein
MMGLYFLITLATLLMFGTVNATGGADQNAREGIETAIRSQIQTYIRSIDAADTTLASTVWASTADVCLIYPRGHEHGWDAIKIKFYEQAMGQNFLERKLTVKELVIHSYDNDTAWRSSLGTSTQSCGRTVAHMRRTVARLRSTGK